MARVLLSYDGQPVWADVLACDPGKRRIKVRLRFDGRFETRTWVPARKVEAVA